MSTALDSPLIIFAMSLFVQWLSAYLGYFLRRKRQSFSKDAHGDFGTVLPLVGVNYQINVSDRMADAQPIGESSGWKPLLVTLPLHTESPMAHP
jgi:hypothetical protein